VSISLAASFYRELFEKYWTEPCMKRSIIIAGRKTSISIEDAFWKGLREITAAKGIKVTDLVAFIDKNRQQGNLSSHVRLFVLEYYQTLAASSNAVEQTASSSTAPISK
jgi:predicted DNA-binding ribbon-helix-helix protein